MRASFLRNPKPENLGKLSWNAPRSAPDAMGGVSNTELNLTHFYTNSKCLLSVWKDISGLNLKQR